MKDGWILGPNGELILWIPPANRAVLLHPSHHILSSPSELTELDFQNFKCGTTWSQYR